MQVLVVIVLTILILLIWVGTHARNLLQQRQEINDLWTKLNQALEKRHELINEFPRVLSNELSPTSGLFEPLKQASSQAQSSKDAAKGQRLAAENFLASAVGDFLQKLEQQSGVLDSESYVTLRQRAIDIEDEITALQSHFNDLVVAYNARQNVFPDRLIVAKMGLKTEDEFPLIDAFQDHHLKFRRETLPARKGVFGLPDEKPSK